MTTIPHSISKQSTLVKHIVIVTDAWHPQVNGVVTTFAEITKHLEQKGYTVLLIHPGLFRTLALPHYTEIMFSVDASYAMGKKLSKLNIDHLHIATEGPLGLAARSYCIHNKVPFTSSYHTHFPKYAKAWHVPFLPNLSYRYFKWFHSPAQATLVTTQALKDELEGHTFEHLTLWPLGVDTDLFVPPSAPQVTDMPRPIFGYLGRLAKEKNVAEFLEAKLPGSKLIIGDGPLREELEEKYPLGTRFVGYQSGKKLVEWLSLCDVFVMPSYTETFGLVMLEALACGIPVAAHDVVGPRQIITNGKDGYLDKDLQRAATKCLSLSREVCRAKALQFSWEKSANVFLENLASIPKGNT